MGTHDIQEFCLKWNNHHSTLVSVLDSLLMKESLVDVVLAAEGQFIKVHRLVLFACSQYFTDLLSLQADKHAVVFLKDVSFNDLKSLVDFMYRGEVNISQYQLDSFLQTAEALKIKGLADKPYQRKYVSSLVPNQEKTSDVYSEDVATTSQNEAQQQARISNPPRLRPSRPATKKAPKIRREETDRQVFFNQSQEVEMESDQGVDTEQLENEDNPSDHDTVKDDDDEGQSVENSQHSFSGVSASGSCGGIRIKMDPANETWTSENGAVASETNCDLTMSDSSQYADAEGNSAEPVILEDPDGGDRPFSCPRCGRRYKRKNNAVSHLRYECGVVPSFPCPICSHMLSQRRYIQKHIRRKHPSYIQNYQEYKDQHKSKTSGDDVD